LEYFEKAVAEDPNYAPAYIGLAGAYLNRKFGYPDFNGNAKAKELTLRALEIDNDLAEGHLMLGNLYCWNDWKWEEARKEFLLAIDLMPNCAAGYATYSNLLDILGQNDEARKYINIALELDPMSNYCIYLSSYYYLHERKFKESLIGFHLLKELAPDDIYVFWNCFLISVWSGENIKAVDELKKVMEMDTATIKYADKVKDIYNQSGMNGILNLLIDLELQKPNPSPIMLVNFYAPQGNKEEVLRLLEKAVDEHYPWIPRLNNTPEVEFIRQEPRFKAMIKKLGLSNYQPKKTYPNQSLIKKL
jgi:tetratricopeptide (TPR) repeat protein